MRGDLVLAFRKGDDAKVRAEYGAWFIGKREKIWEDYRALPWAWRETAMEGYSLPDNLIAKLEVERVEQNALSLNNNTGPATSSPRRMRI